MFARSGLLEIVRVRPEEQPHRQDRERGRCGAGGGRPPSTGSGERRLLDEAPCMTRATG
jgi:hypothetical protein